MLKHIPPILNGDLLKILRDMGHGDELTISDANYPSASNHKRLVRIDGADTTTVLEAILTLMPLDEFVDSPVLVMSPGPGEAAPVAAAYQAVCDKVIGGKPVKITPLPRFDFYPRAAQSYACIATAERRLYGDLIIKKGILRPGE